MNRTKLHRPANLDRRGLVLAAPLLAGVLPGCAGAILARGRVTKGGRLLARGAAALDVREPPRPGLIGALAWSPDGSRIAASGFGGGGPSPAPPTSCCGTP